MASRIDYNNPNATGAFGLPYHYEMVSDDKRVNPLAQAIQKACKGKRVLESGTGSGILSLLAAQAGAKKVYAVERDPAVFKFAKKNFAASPYADKIKLIWNDTMKVGLKDLDGEKVDVVIAENLSTWEVTEPQVLILNYISKNLAKSSAIRIPGTVLNQYQLVQTNFSFKNLIKLRTYYFEFTGIKKAKNLSGVELFSKIDLSKINPVSVKKSVVLPITSSGTLNAVRLTSPLEIYGSAKFSSSDSLMPPVIMPLPQDISVKKGQKVKLEIEYKYHAGWENFYCKANVV